jgi:hypothetical protein
MNKEENPALEGDNDGNGEAGGGGGGDGGLWHYVRGGAVLCLHVKAQVELQSISQKQCITLQFQALSSRRVQLGCQTRTVKLFRATL